MAPGKGAWRRQARALLVNQKGLGELPPAEAGELVVRFFAAVCPFLLAGLPGADGIAGTPEKRRPTLWRFPGAEPKWQGGPWLPDRRPTLDLPIAPEYLVLTGEIANLNKLRTW